MSALIEALAREVGLGVDLVRRIAGSAPFRYKTFEIPKKAGGVRVISQPAAEVKQLQRALVSIVLNDLPVHDSAIAYRVGKSILDNARLHAGYGPVLKLDFRNFFPSIRGGDWRQYCDSTGCLSGEDDLRLTTSILFRREKHRSGLRLAIGAPSSPILSNILMYDFDQMVAGKCREEGVIYSRYADDLTFSAPRTGFLTRVEKIVASTIREIGFPRLTINAEKTTYVTRKFGRRVTGLVLSNDGLVTIGRDRKRELRAAVHRASLNELSPAQMARLGGMLAFVWAMEPAFISVLEARYGANCVQRVRLAGKNAPKRVGRTQQEWA
ncbi:retron St85 family RNA-directed DNA polymerase [Kaistia granuli]|uniref:retron St85 family RNA-directed DNA polymerase n=1 Tax=Kaistia granuli TaxID=363259 RepID=UPI000A077B24